MGTLPASERFDRRGEVLAPATAIILYRFSAEHLPFSRLQYLGGAARCVVLRAARGAPVTYDAEACCLGARRRAERSRLQLRCLRNVCPGLADIAALARARALG